MCRPIPNPNRKVKGMNTKNQVENDPVEVRGPGGVSR